MVRRSVWWLGRSTVVCEVAAASRSAEEGLDVGEDTGTPVNLSYDVPFKFTGRLGKVMIDLR
jgi:arylsulfatase